MDRLAMTFLRLGQAMRALIARESHGEGLTPAQAQALLFVRHTKSFATTIGNLALWLASSHASAVGVVDSLERRGLLTREVSDRDRRVTLLRLTPEGERVASVLARWGDALSEALAEMTPEDRRVFELGLGRVLWSLQEAGALFVAEPCRGCAYFRENALPGSHHPHRCALIDAYLSEEESRKLCPDHTPVANFSGK